MALNGNILGPSQKTIEGVRFVCHPLGGKIANINRSEWVSLDGRLKGYRISKLKFKASIDGVELERIFLSLTGALAAVVAAAVVAAAVVADK